MLEKTLKSLIIKRDKEILPLHDLVRLASVAGLDLTEDQRAVLREITTFNIEARYDDYKEQFYKKATQKYALIWNKKSEEVYKWIKEQV